MLNVAEKPSVARGIAEILGGRDVEKRPGLSQFNPVFEFPFCLQGQPCTMVVTSVAGHLMELDVASNYKAWHSCSPIELFDSPVVKSVPEDKRDLQRTLQREVRSCAWLTLWLDCDREGENICFEVIDVCHAALSGRALSIFRARFSAVTPQEIRHACEHLVQPDPLQSAAVDARQELDLRTGAAFTRLQSMQLRSNHGLQQVVSYGSCQFPTLGFVVDRYNAALNFEPEDFWTIQVTLPTPVDDPSTSAPRFRWHRGRLFDRFSCFVLLERLLEAPLARIASLRQKQVHRWKPLPLTTITFQKLAARKLRMSSHKAMLVAEELYTQGYISYPRTETDQFPQSIDLMALVREQGANPWGDFAEGLLSAQGFSRPRDGKNNDNSHPPIHPTKAGGSSLTGDKARVYELISRHFLAACSKDAVGFQTDVDIEINKEMFSAKGLIILERNYLLVYPYDNWSGNELPHFTVGQTIMPSNIEMTQGTTQAPPLLTEADLISLMHQNGIGTDATIAQHIETILKREYVFVQEGRFVPSTLGLGLVLGYADMKLPPYLQIVKPSMRAEFEKDLVKIVNGIETKDTVVRRNIKMYRDLFERIDRQFGRVIESLSRHFMEDSPG